MHNTNRTVYTFSTTYAIHRRNFYLKSAPRHSAKICTVQLGLLYFKNWNCFSPVKIDKKLEDVNPKMSPQNVNLP